jgi:hypothetical protein
MPRFTRRLQARFSQRRAAEAGGRSLDANECRLAAANQGACPSGNAAYASWIQHIRSGGRTNGTAVTAARSSPGGQKWRRLKACAGGSVRRWLQELGGSGGLWQTNGGIRCSRTKALGIPRQKARCGPSSGSAHALELLEPELTNDAAPAARAGFYRRAAKANGTAGQKKRRASTKAKLLTNRSTPRSWLMPLRDHARVADILAQVKLPRSLLLLPPEFE